MDATSEELVQAEHSAGFAYQHLRNALKTASPMEALVLLPAIEMAGSLVRNIKALRDARAATDTEGLGDQTPAVGDSSRSRQPRHRG